MLTRSVRQLSVILAGMGVVLLISYAMATLLDGISRSLFKNPIDAVRDLGGLIVGVSIAGFMPLAFLERANIDATFIDGLVPKKAAQGLSLLAAVVTFVFMIFFAWQFFLNARNFLAAGEVTPMLGFARAPFWFVIDFMLWCAVVAQVMVVMEVAREFLGVRAPPPTEDGTAHPSV